MKYFHKQNTVSKHHTWMHIYSLSVSVSVIFNPVSRTDICIKNQGKDYNELKWFWLQIFRVPTTVAHNRYFKYIQPFHCHINQIKWLTVQFTLYNVMQTQTLRILNTTKSCTYQDQPCKVIIVHQRTDSSRPSTASGNVRKQ